MNTVHSHFVCVWQQPDSLKVMKKGNTVESLSIWKFPSWKLILFRNRKIFGEFHTKWSRERSVYSRCFVSQVNLHSFTEIKFWQTNIWCFIGKSSDGSTLCFVNLYVLFKKHSSISLFHSCRTPLIVELSVITNAPNKIPQSWSTARVRSFH